jgi:rhamnulokinase
MTTTHLLAIDLGASSGRVMHGWWNGAQLGLRELRRFTHEPATVRGQTYWDILAIWREILAGIADYGSTGAALDGIGVATWGLDFGLLDAHGRLLGNPTIYRDPRTVDAPAAIAAQVPLTELFQRTGIELMRVNTVCQLWSMARAADPQLTAASTLLMLPDLLRYWLSGACGSEYTIATTTQLLDCHTRTWATDLIARLELPIALLPPVIASGTIVGPLVSPLQRETGLRAAPQVIAVTGHDTASAVVAVPGLDRRSAYISSGTWSLMGIERATPLVSAAALALGLTNEGGAAGTVRVQKNITGLWLLQESRRQWARAGQPLAWPALVALAEQAAPFAAVIDPDRPEFGVPGDVPGAIRAFCHTTNQPVPETIGAVVRCCLEALALRYRWTVDALERVTGDPITTIRVVGGGAQNRLLCQLTADICGRPVVAGPVEATALGNIIQQLVALGALPDIAAGRATVARAWSPETFEPRRDPLAEAAYARFCALVG